MKKSKFDPGDLNCNVAYEELYASAAAPPRNIANEPNLVDDSAWKKIFPEWVKIEAIAGREVLYAQEINAQTTHRVTAWYYAKRSTRGRFLYVDPATGNKRYLNIQAFINIDEGCPVYQICFCLEQTP